MKLTPNQRRALLAVAHRGHALMGKETRVHSDRTTVNSGTAHALRRLGLVTMQGQRLSLTNDGRAQVELLNERGA